VASKKRLVESPVAAPSKRPALAHPEVPSGQAGQMPGPARPMPAPVFVAGQPAQQPRKRGRPKGSKNGSSAKARALLLAKERAGKATVPAPAAAPAQPPRKRGRPKGSKNGTTKARMQLAALRSSSVAPVQPAAADPLPAAEEAPTPSQAPRKRGRPKGSKNTPLGEQTVQETAT
jgi:hypothetical protein